jgi:peptidoglycan L-alanyl-D-glutamate endopeptidase CwlK
MHSKRTLEALAGLNKKFRAKAEKFLASLDAVKAKYGITIEVISGLRSYQQQAALFAQGRTKPGKRVTNARPGSSWHNYGLAIDLGLFKAGKYLDESNPALADAIYLQIATIAEAQGLEWAGRWRSFMETPHFQDRFGMTLSQARAKLQAVNYDIQKLV